MRNLYVLAAALDIVEDCLREPINVEDLAKKCYISVSGLQKLFGYAFKRPVGEYVSRRRLSEAAHELIATNKSITEIALEFQYGSPEAFSRGFKKMWSIPPSAFRRERRFSGLFPRFELDFENGGYIMPGRRKVDITELYGELKKQSGTWVICVDIKGLMAVNDNYGHAAGDLVIAEVAARIDREISGEMLMFRVGGDEFAVVTGYRNEKDALALAERIEARNGQEVISDDKGIPVSIRTGAMKIPEKGLKYAELFPMMTEAGDLAREREKANS